MKQLQKKLLFLLVWIPLVGCHSGWSEDPFANYDDNVKNGKIPNLKPAPDEVLPGTAFIDAKSIYSFTEGSPNEVEFSFRLAKKNLVFKRLFIKDMDRIFPGSEFDPVALKWVWTPPEDFISGDEYSRTVASYLVLEFSREDGVLFSVRQDFQVQVTRKDEGPIITKISDFPVELEEGEEHEFQIEVYDPDSLGAKNPSPPRLEVLQTSKRFDARSLVKIDPNAEVVASKPAHWNFTGTIDLRDQEITPSKKDIELGFRAVGRFGAYSTLEERSVTVYSALEEPVLSWMFLSTIEGQVGKQLVTHFSAFNRKDEGSLRVTFATDCGSLPGGASCSCNVASNDLSNCEVSWTPTEAGEFAFVLDVEVKGEKNRKKNKTFTRYIKIEEAVTP